jgi:SecD/SecF fusion protein
MSLHKRSLLLVLLVLGLLAASLVVIAVKPTVLGLDLKGGSAAILEGRDTVDAKVTPDSINRAIGVIRKRIDAFGVSEAEIQKVGDRQIQVAIPNITDPTVINDLVKAAQLSLYAYEPNLVGRVPGTGPSPANPTTNLYELITLANTTPPQQPVQGSESFYLFRKDAAHTYVEGPQLTKKDLLDQLALRQPAVSAEYLKNPAAFEVRTVPKGFVILTDGTNAGTGKPKLCGQGGTCVLLYDNVGLRGNDLKGATLQFDNLTNDPTVDMQFSGQGRKNFADVTRQIATGAAAEHLGPGGSNSWHFAIVLDGVIISNPIVNYEQYPSGIDSDRAQISGGFTEKTARTLADQLSSGAVPINLETVSLQTVSATLGKQSLRQGLIAGLVGLLLVMIALIAYYRLLGVVASVSLIIYGIYFWAIAKLIPIALSLPGIAGLILTIGVAADASVVIFERVREETRAGRPPRTAILNGYRRGLTAIVDANIVTLVTAVFIFLLSTAGPRGFAFTLILGVLLSLFTTIVATQGILGLLVETKYFKNDRLMGLNAREHTWKMDIVGRWKFWIAISFVPMLAGVLVIGIRGLQPGLDFSSGTRVSVGFTQQNPDENALRGELAALGISTAKIQAFTRQGQGGRNVKGYEIETKTLTPAQTTKVLQGFTSKFGPIDQGVQKIDTVGPTFGRDIVRRSIWAVVFSFIAIILYLSFRFEYKLALSALLSVVHDVWLALAVYSIAGKEVTSATVAALLTILGYSLYDVVIVFDRIRENAPLMRGRPYRDIVNRSVHETLTRSIITMILTLLPITALLVFGGPTLRDFSFALLIGILSGGVSSIFISAPVAALWKEHEPDARKLQARLDRKAARAAAVDADIMDVAAFNRAEAALDAPAGGAGNTPASDDAIDAAPADVAGDVGPAVAVDDSPALPAGDAARVPGEDADGGADGGSGAAGDGTSGPAAPPERQRRHRSVQRKRRR